MANNFRVMGIEIEFNADSAVSGTERVSSAMRQLATVTDLTDDQLAELNATTQGYATVSRTTEANARQLNNEMRRQARAYMRTNNSIAQVQRQYAHLTRSIGMTDDELQVLNAQMALGEHANDAQREAIGRTVREYQQLRNAATATGGSFRWLRGQSQNLGWQMQDIAVQAQMGTSAFTIFAQQGSQLASGFGQMGALVGAFIAVGGAIASVVFNMKDMKEQEDLIKANTTGLVKSLYERAKAGKVLAADELKAAEMIQQKKISAEKVAVTEILKERDKLAAQIHEQQERERSGAMVPMAYGMER